MQGVDPTLVFARNLRRQREKAGLSQEALGDRCELHRTEISLLERAAREFFFPGSCIRRPDPLN